MKTQELIKKISEFNPYCEHATLATIFSKMRIGKFNVINYGPAGTGKSHSTINLLKLLNLGTEITIDNNTTKKGFFQLLMDFPEQDIVLDECFALLKERGVQDAIKLAMEGKSVHWIKDGSRETTPPFKGNFIINTNEYVIPSVIDRCFFNKTIMNKEMALNYIDYTQKKHEFAEFIDYIKKVINDKKNIQLTEEETKKIIEFIKDNINESEEGLEYSRRCIERIISYMKCAKKLFGKLDEEVLNFIIPYAELYVINSKTPSLIEAIVSTGEIDKSELIKKLAKEGGYSDRHARRLVNEAITEGMLSLKGRLVMIST